MPEDVDFAPRKGDAKYQTPEAKRLDEAYNHGFESGKDEGGSGDDSGGAASVKIRGSKLSFSNDAQKIIVICITITGIVAIIESLNTGPNERRAPVGTILVGTFISGGLLLGMSYFLPEFASGLSIVAMLATVLDRGKPFWMAIERTSTNTANITGGGPPKPKGGTLPDLSSSGTLPGKNPRPLDPAGPGLPSLDASGVAYGPGQKPGSNPYANIPGQLFT